MKPTLWYTLFIISKIGAFNKAIIISTANLAKKLGVSQQTASRHLIELENIGFISREPSFQGVKVKITNEGVEELRKVYLMLKPIFEKPLREMILHGKVFSGFGDGSYYMGMEEYKCQFVEKLGFDPYPGTLNLKLEPLGTILKKELKSHPSIIIEGFKKHGRTFSRVNCYHVIINDLVNGALIMINRTHYDESVLELIAPINLRNNLDLNDGSVVKVKVLLLNS
ncbi:MAG: DUF120 domain-containing protein [Candidatus Bathyarchaeota archaeon]|nr:MAG: DUF120 domain-containing protein [Candidatus Bathyarchaeota archaeon]